MRGTDQGDTLSFYYNTGNKNLYGINSITGHMYAECDVDWITGSNTNSGSYIEVLEGGGGNDDIRSGDGEDHIYGGAGQDYVEGGNHNDDINGGPDGDWLNGGAGADVVEGQGGNDRICDESVSSSPTLDEPGSYSGLACTASGSSGDTLRGGDGNDRIYAYGGSDIIDA